MLRRLLWLSLAGACGTVSRYALSELAGKVKTGHFPLGTFTVNVIGSFLFGLVYALAARKIHFSGEVKLILLVGFMGAFTTFSTFAFDTARLLKASHFALAFGNIFLQVLLGMVALVAGILLGRML